MITNAVNAISTEEQRGYEQYRQRVAGLPVEPASLDVWVDRERFTRDFSQGRALADGLASDPVGRRRGGQDEMTQARMDKLVSEWTRARQIGIQPATILNMSPLQLQGAGPLTSHIVIPPCPPGQLASRYVIESPKTVTDMQYSWRDERDDNWSPVLWYPIQLARDFEEIYYSKGGVVIYAGDFDPMESPKVMEAIKEAEKRMIAYAREQWRDAMHQWNSPNRTGARNIGVLHRAYAQMLLDRQVYSDVPPWFDATPATKGLGDKCNRCKTVAQKDAYMCAHCGYIIDPHTAYLEQEIDEINPALQRLSRSVLIELGVSRFVQETNEERKARIARGGEVAPMTAAELEPDDEDDDSDVVEPQPDGQPPLTRAQRKAAKKAALEAAKRS